MGLVDRFSSFSLPGAYGLQLYAVIGLVVLLLVAVVLYQIHLFRRRSRGVRMHSLQELDRLAVDKKLTPDEKEVLLDLADKYGIRDVLSVATDRRAFEHCIKREQEEIRALGASARADAQETVTRLRAKLGFDRARFGQVLHSSKQVAPGRAVTVEGRLDGERYTLFSSVLHNEEAGLTLARPRQKGAYVGFEPGERITVRFFREGDGEYFFVTPVVSVGAESMKVAHDERMERNQVRSAVRTDAAVPVEFFVVPSPRYPDKDAPPLRPEDALHGTIRDISSGGAKIETGDDPGGAEYLNLRFTLGDTLLENVTARLHKVMGAGRVRFLNIEFMSISDDERARITVFVNETQIWNKKGTY